MKDFRLYDIHDFLLDEDFIRFARLRKAEDVEFWTKWMEGNPDKQLIVAEAKGILEKLGVERSLVTLEEREEAIREVLETIGRETSYQTKDKIRQQGIGYRTWLSIAAILLLMVLGGLFFFSRADKKPIDAFAFAEEKPSEKMIESVNSSDEAVTLQLPDKSTVRLSPNSRIAYSNDFDSSGTRDIYLVGEAIFSVQKNPSRPFRVFANEIMTKVLGTSFLVRSFRQDSVIRVSVNSGKVSVFLQEGAREEGRNKELEGIILTPNQELVYQKSRHRFRKVLRDNPMMIVPDGEDNNLVYEDSPLEKVLRQLTENFGVSILFDNDLLGSCTITADLRTVPFYEKLDLICKAIGGRFEIIDGQVIIQSSGCQ